MRHVTTLWIPALYILIFWLLIELGVIPIGWIFSN